MGAPDPRAGVAAAAEAGIDLEAGRRFWAFRRPAATSRPAVTDAAWPRTEIDRFVLAGLEAKGLRPAARCRPGHARTPALLRPGRPAADARGGRRLRRRPVAGRLRALVDRLLASPHFGERWGRHWLDVARFGESLTLRGFVLKEAWRYRDYVIDAFNADLPFDRFVREQIAGDLLPAASLAERAAAADRHHVPGPRQHQPRGAGQGPARMDVVDEQLDTIGKAFLAQTIGCARCHDHKFDPIPTRDYYALAGILRNTKTLEHANVSKWLELPLPVDPEQEVGAPGARGGGRRPGGPDQGGRGSLASSGKGSAPGRGDRRRRPAGIVVDDAQARKVGVWKESQYSGSYIGAGYLHDDNGGKGEKSLTFQPKFPDAGNTRSGSPTRPGRADRSRSR